MKNPVYEQIQARKVKARLRMLQHAQRVAQLAECRIVWRKRHPSADTAP